MPLSALFQQYSYFLPILVFLFYFKKIKDWHLWVVFFYCLYSYINDTIVVYRFRHNLAINNLLYSFTIIEYLIFALCLFKVLKNNISKKVLLVVSALFLLFCFYAITHQTLKKFDSVQSSLSAIILISFCIIYLFEQINKPDITFIYASHTFWIVAGILIYLAATLFLYGFAASLPDDVAQDYWIINHASTILKNILFFIAILVYAKSLKLPKSKKPVEAEFHPYLN